MIRSVIAAIKCCVSIIIVICICPPRALIWLINLFLFLKKKKVINRCANRIRTTFDAEENFLFWSIVQWIHLGLSCYGLFGTKADQSIYYLRTKFQDGIDKPQKCRNICYHPTHQQQSDFLILVLYMTLLFRTFCLHCYCFVITLWLWMIMNKL